MGTILSVLSILLSFLFWKYKPEDFVKAFKLVYHSKFLKNTLKIAKYIFKIKVICAFLFCAYYYYLIALLVWLKFELSINGAVIAFCTFTSLTIATVFYFKGAFKDLFFPKNNNNQKPFSIV
jgi:integral membrane sensor domain MASE1